MDVCGRCGRRPAVGGWCDGCRQAAAHQVGGGYGPGPAEGRPAAVPPALWAAIGLFAGAALLALLGALSSIATFNVYGVVALLLPLIGALALPAAWTVIAVGLYRGSRVARCAAWVVGPTALVAGPAGGFGGAALALAVLLGAAGPLPAALSARARAFFDGPWGARPVQAPSVVVARFVLVVFGGLAALAAVVGLLGGIVAVASSTVAASSVRSGGGGELGEAFGGLIGVLGGALGSFMIVFGVLWGGMAF